MELNTDIINVLTKDFSFVKTTLENSNIENITKSLNSLTITLNKCAKSIEDMKAKLSEDVLNTIFFPYFNAGQFLNEIKNLSESIIVVSGIDIKSDEFTYIKNNAWLRYEKIVVDESHGEMVKNYTSIYVDMFKVANPRNPILQLKHEPISDDIEVRYAKFVEMANQRLTMKEIAVAFNLSLPGIYFIRAQIKDRLLSDIDVNKKSPAMKFNGKRKQMIATV